jgi:hypothetical protein
MSRLTDVISLLYRMEDADIAALANELTTARARAWRLALTEEARKMGCTGAAKSPAGQDRIQLEGMSRKDAESIANTWNRDVTRRIEALYRANPRGNRNYYFSNLERWARERAVWKQAQIAMQTEQTTRFYAQRRFRVNNGITGGRYVFTGPAPVCRVCVREFARGVVTESYIRTHPAPRHIGCPHEWTQIATQRIPCNEIWLG